MIRDITLGQYYHADSILHKLDPRVKIIGTVIYLVSMFMFHTWGFILGIAFLIFAILASKVPFSFMTKGLKAVWILLVFTMILNVFLTGGDHILWQWRFLRMTEEGVYKAVKAAVRLVALILGASVMTLTTTPTRLTDGLERVLSPLKKLHVPVHEIAMMMSIALRFIPILMEETDKIMKAQMARGADFETGTFIEKIRAMIPILVPLFVSAFRRANDLAMAMEARCYRGDVGRTQMKPLRYKRIDYTAYVILLLYLLISIAFCVIGI